MIIWFTGLSGSGKTTLARYLKEILERNGFSVFHIDGDVFRTQYKKENRFCRKDIIENNRNIISYCSQLKKNYDFLLVSVIAPYQKTRDEARKIFQKEYLEIFLNCPLEILIKNDVKGLYKKAKKGEIKNLIGFSQNSPYEKPQKPDLEIRTDKTNIEESLKQIIDLIKKNGISI